MNFAIDPETRDYRRPTNGEFDLDKTSATPTILALMDEMGRFYGDLDLGSRVREIMKGDQDADQEEKIQAACEETLSRLITAGSISDFAVIVVADAAVPGRLIVTTNTVDKSGVSQSTVLTVT